MIFNVPVLNLKVYVTSKLFPAISLIAATGMVTWYHVYSFGILITPAAGVILMSLSTIIVAFNSRTLKIEK